MRLSLVPTPAVGNTEAQVLTLTTGTYVLGRSRSVDLPVNDPNASRRHARLIVGPKGTYIEDLGSKNGTLVNGAPLLARVPLVVGDHLTIGTQEYIVRASLDRDPAVESLQLSEEMDWEALSDQTERTLDLLDVLLSERRGGQTHTRALVPLVVTAVDEVLDSVGTTRPALTQRQAVRMGHLIGALTKQAYSPMVYAWQTTARRRLNTLVQQSYPPTRLANR